MGSIEFDESENLYSDVTDITLNFVLDMYGPEVRDWLLVPVVGTIVDIRCVV